jgi:hypothetical protein
MTAPDLFAKPEPPRRGTRLPSDWGWLTSFAENCGSRSAQKAHRMGTCCLSSAACSYMFPPGIDEAGRAGNTGTASNHPMPLEGMQNG